MKRTNGAKTKKTAQKRRSLGAMCFEQEDLTLLYKAPRAYQATDEEENLLSVLTEGFEQVLAIDYLKVSYY